MLPWIKHHCDAHTNRQLSILIEKYGVEAYGRYWLFLEHLCQIYKKGSPPEFTLTRRDMLSVLHLYHNSTLSVHAEYLSSTLGVDVKYIDGTYKVKAPILLELLDSDFKRARQRRDSDTANILDTRYKIQDITYSPLKDDQLPEVKSLSELWNKNRGRLSEVKKLTPNRLRKIKAQLKQYPDLSHWADVLKKWSAPGFAAGEWSPGFDDWLSEDKRIKTLEGKYDNWGLDKNSENSAYGIGEF